MREKEEQVWQELNSTREKMQKKVQPLLTKTYLSMRENQELQNFLNNVSQDRYKGDKYKEFNEKLKASKEEYERQKKEKKEMARKRFEETRQRLVAAKIQAEQE